MTIIDAEDPMLNKEFKLVTMIALNLWVLVCLTPPTLGFECLSPSYTVRQGKNYTDDVTPRELASGEYENLKQLFQWMEGDWVGRGRTVKCVGPEDGIRIETESYTVSTRGKYRSYDQFTFENHIYIQEERTTADQTYDFYLNERRLATADISVSDIEILKVSATELSFIKKARIKGAGLFTVHEWVVSLRKISDTSLEVENVFSANGRLTSTSILRVERK
jgi:hypothetical protein